MARFVALLLLGLFTVCGTPAAAASPWSNLADPVFVRIDTRELPEAAVMAVAQDRAGFLWVGTQGGLTRFDGYHFRTFLPNPADPKALPDGYIRTILPDPDGGLWIGSSSNGLVHFDAATETFRTWHPAAKGGRGPRSSSVNTLVPSAGGDLWVGGDGGLDRFDRRSGTFEPVALTARSEQPVVWTLLADRAGALWAGTQSGLFERARGSARFLEFPLHAVTRPAMPTIYSLYEDGAHRLWAGSVDAVFTIDPQHRTASVLRSVPHDNRSLASGEQWSITEVTPGVVWVGTDSALSIVDASTRQVRRVAPDLENPGGLSGGRILQFLRDRSGLLWIANHVGGLLLYNPLVHGLYELSATRPEIGFGNEGAIAVAAGSAGRLWAGGFLGHLAEFDARSGHAITRTLPNRAAVETLLAGNGGTLWIGTTEGLCRLQAGGDNAPICPATPSRLAGSDIYSMDEDGSRLWIGGSGGLLVDDTAGGKVRQFPSDAAPVRLSNSQVRTLYIDRARRLWAGTENGLNRIDPDGRVARFVFSPQDGNSIGPGGITSILEDRRGRIWAGADGGPLDLLEDPDGDPHVRRLGVAAGIPHENVDGLEEDAGGRIWASTDKGIAVIDPDTLRAQALGLADGVSEGAHWAGAVSKSADGTIFFGGLDGITVVTPGATSPWTYAPPLVVSALELGRRYVPTWGINQGDATVELPASTRDITVEFSSLDYSAPQTLRYTYKLDGYDRDWVDADSRHRIATYTHLPPGDYTLEVRGTNRLGVWSSHGIRLGVRALPAWYETWWFRLSIAALLLLAAYGVHRLRTAVLRRRQHELETIVADRTRELSEANTKLQDLSLSDPLTGLRNRRFLTQHIEADISRTLRRYEDADSADDPPQDVDVLFFLVDLDQFKAVNDRYGHNAGDMLLVQMRERLEEVFRESDFIVRWGGDEFLAVARDSHRSDAGAIAERIREAVAGRPFVLGAEQSINATVSVGFAAFPFVPAAPLGLSWLQVVRLADHALYMAKHAGRNAWFGLSATSRTDSELLVQWLESSAEDVVRAGSLQVLVFDRTPRI